MFAAKDALEQVVPSRWLESFVNSVEQDVEELLCILLLARVGRAAFHLFE